MKPTAAARHTSRPSIRHPPDTLRVRMSASAGQPSPTVRAKRTWITAATLGWPAVRCSTLHAISTARSTTPPLTSAAAAARAARSAGAAAVIAASASRACGRVAATIPFFGQSVTRRCQAGERLNTAASRLVEIAGSVITTERGTQLRPHLDWEVIREGVADRRHGRPRRRLAPGGRLSRLRVPAALSPPSAAPRRGWDLGHIESKEHAQRGHARQGKVAEGGGRRALLGERFDEAGDVLRWAVGWLGGAAHTM